SLLAFAFAATLACATQSADAKVLVTIDKSTQEMTVAVDGVTRWQWPVSTGARGYATPNGTFTAFRMEAEHFSKEFDDAQRPLSLSVTQRGHALQVFSVARRMGSPVSRGCVRLTPANATKLYALVEQQGVTNTTVVVTGSEAAAVARRAP